MAPEKASERYKSGKNSPSQMDDAPEGVCVDISALSWPEMFSRHELNLRNHLKLCGTIKEHVLPESDAFQRIAHLVDKTQNLMKEAEKLRTEFTSQSTASRILSGHGVKKVDLERPPGKTQSQQNGHGNAAAPTSTGNTHDSTTGQDDTHKDTSPPFVFDTQPTPVSMPQRPRNKKRPLEEDEQNTESTASGSNFGNAAKATKKSKPGSNSKTPANGKEPREGEDISDEVERRLKIREERRQKRKEKEQHKRKRNSSVSNAESNDGSGVSPKRRKVKTEDTTGVEPNETDGKQDTSGKKRDASDETVFKSGKKAKRSS